MKNIFILTGEIKTGKTTRLMQWATNKTSIDGIFQPVIDGRRFIYHISSKTLKPLETMQTENIISIGKYKFSIQTFEWAQEILREAFNNQNKWIIIDEVGPLELKGTGLEPEFHKLISETKNSSVKLILVIRNSILNDVIKFYNLEGKFQIIEKLEELN